MKEKFKHTWILDSGMQKFLFFQTEIYLTYNTVYISDVQLINFMYLYIVIWLPL